MVVRINNKNHDDDVKADKNDKKESFLTIILQSGPAV